MEGPFQTKLQQDLLDIQLAENCPEDFFGYFKLKKNEVLLEI